MTVVQVGWNGRRPIVGAVREFVVPLVIVAAFGILGVAAAEWRGIRLAADGSLLWLLGYQFAVAGFFALTVLYIRRWLVRDSDGWIPGRRGWRASLRQEWETGVLPDRLARIAVAAGLLAVATIVFGALKSAIPYFHPFAWDARLSRWSIAIHGRPDWAWLPSWTQSPGGLLSLEHCYTTFVPMLSVVTLWRAWDTDETNRRRFFLSFALAWFLIGIVAATWLSSAGPAFYGRLVGGPDPYAPLLANLRHAAEVAGLRSPMYQDLFWQQYRTGHPTPFTGISAMPSMHVAMPVLYAFAARRWWSRAAFIGYGVAIWLATVALGWHYAFDGYVSAIMIAALWWGTKRLIPEDSRQP